MPIEHSPSVFKQQCVGASGCLGGRTMQSGEYDEAALQYLYSIALAVAPPSPHGIFIKRSAARVATGRLA